MRHIFLGYSCNNACVFCAQGNLRTIQTDLDDSSIRKRISDALEGSPADRDVAFCGGEPTLHDPLPEWIREAKRLQARWVLVQTNGRRLVYPRFARSLADSGLDALDISLHGCSAAMHDYHTGIPGSWLQTLAGIERAREAGLAVGATTVITRSNFRHLPDIVRLAHQAGAEAVHLDLAEPFGKALAARDRVVPAAEMVHPHLLTALREARRLKLGVFSGGKAGLTRIRRLFAGLGTAEPPSIPAAQATKDLATPKRPRPGIKEVHTPRKLTGENLRSLFPGIFNPEH